MIEIYGKADCSYCVKAKNLLDTHMVAYDYFSIGEDITTEEVIEKFPGVRTVPVVAVNGNLLGGYEQLAQLIEEKKSGLGI